jgi:hypothetical protein
MDMFLCAALKKKAQECSKKYSRTPVFWGNGETAIYRQSFRPFAPFSITAITALLGIARHHHLRR